MWTWVGSSLLILVVGKFSFFLLIVGINLVLLMYIMSGSDPDKNDPLWYWDFLSLANLNGAPTLSCMLRIAFKRIETIIQSIKFIPSETVLYLCKSTIGPSMEYCSIFWSEAPIVAWICDI